MPYILNQSGGGNGASGYSGFSGLPGGLIFTYSSNTSAPAATGEMRGSGATFINASTLYVSLTESIGADVTPIIAALKSGDRINVVDLNNKSASATFLVSSITNNTTYYTIGTSSHSGSGTFTNGDLLEMRIVVSGTSGFSGYSGLTGGVGTSGFSGYSGVSGWSGASGATGQSGFSGYSGYSGRSGYSGMAPANTAMTNASNTFTTGPQTIYSSIILDSATNGATRAVTAKSDAGYITTLALNAGQYGGGETAAGACILLRSNSDSADGTMEFYLNIGGVGVTKVFELLADGTMNLTYGNMTMVGKLTTTGIKLTGGSAPGSPTEGQMYFNSTDKHLYCWNGTAWKQLDN